LKRRLFDVALSFAGEDRGYVEQVARLLPRRGVSAFYDEAERVELWGEDLYDALDQVYRLEARYVVMFVSEHYAAKRWPTHERRSAQARAIQDEQAYILPVRFDDVDVPGLSNISYIDARDMTPEQLVDLICTKIEAGSADLSDSEVDNELGWEFLLLGEELKARLEALDTRRWYHDIGYVRPTLERIRTRDAAIEDLQTRTREIVLSVSNVGRLFGESTLEQAWGAPGEPGNSERIRQLAAALVEIYESMLDFAERARGATVPKEFESVYWALAGYVNQPLRQVEDFVNQFGEELRDVIGKLRTGATPEEPVRLEFTLTLSIDPEDKAAFDVAMADLQAGNL
jgi:hypothetical protein